MAIPTASAQEPGSAEGLPLCRGCGVLVDASRARCATCDTPYGAPLFAPRAARDGYWVAVRATFTCNACRFDVPLNHFELRDGVSCTRCGLEQRYDPASWRRLLDFAHAVGDLGAPGPDGRFPHPHRPLPRPKPYVELGVRACFVAEQEFRATLGAPLCASCRAPRVVSARRGPLLEVACSVCRDKCTYELPEHVRDTNLAGVVADEHEAGRREAAVNEEGGVVVLRCPNCSGPLHGVKDEDGVVTCTFCRVPCRISARTHARAGHKGTPVKTWWLYFEGPSARRAELLSTAQHHGRAGNPVVGALLLVLLSVAAVGSFAAFMHFTGAREEEDRRAVAVRRPGDAAVVGYSFAMSRVEVFELFGVDVEPGEKLALRDDGVFRELVLGGHGGPTQSISLDGGPRLDAQRTLARLTELAPNRFEADANGTFELGVARSLLRVDPKPQGSSSARLSVMTWVPGEPGVAAANTLLTALRYAAIDGPQPTPAQKRFLRGALLTEIASFDGGAVEEASRRFTATFPAGACVTSTDIASKRTELTCSIDVDDAFSTEIRFAWPSSSRARLARVTLVRSKRSRREGASPDTCLTRALGRGEREVIDFATGRTATRWPVGAGGLVTSDDAAIEITARSDARPDAVATATATLANALAACAPRRP